MSIPLPLYSYLGRPRAPLWSDEINACGSPSAVLGTLPGFPFGFTRRHGAFLPCASDVPIPKELGQYGQSDGLVVQHVRLPPAHPSVFSTGLFRFGDSAHHRNATRVNTSTLKAWLSEHRKNPYPTKREKIMLAIVTQMSVAQVSTWFANARRRLRKESKVTWVPKGHAEAADVENTSDTKGGVEDKKEMEKEEEIDRENTDTENTIRKALDCQGDSLKSESEAADGGHTDISDPHGSRFLSRMKAEHKAVESNSSHPSPQKPKFWSLVETAVAPDKHKSATPGEEPVAT